MPPQKRPPTVTQLTGERRNKAQALSLHARRTQKYCGLAVNSVSSDTSVTTLLGTVYRGLRRTVQKKLFMLIVPECMN